LREKVAKVAASASFSLLATLMQCWSGLSGRMILDPLAGHTNSRAR